MRFNSELRQRLDGVSLATAEVVYFMPDHPSVLQSFIWQTMDEAPKFPRICRFLDFWRSDIEAVIHSVRVAHAMKLSPNKWRSVETELKLH